MTDCTPQDSGRITTSSDVIDDLLDEIARLERELAQALAAADVEAREADSLRAHQAQREPLSHEQALRVAKACGINFHPAQFSSTLETETDEHTLYQFAKALMAACGITAHKEQA